jgi:hypothetical protein
MQMKTLIAMTFAAVLGIAATSAQALPVAPVNQAGLDMITTIAGGCGEGWHRGPNGGCRKNYAQPWQHPCPRGYHIGPNGGCRANGR